MTATAAESLLDLNAAIAQLGVSRPTLFRLIADGDLPVVKIRARSLIRQEDLDALIRRSVQVRGPAGTKEDTS
jgi:excisionase family DNA binding protein